MNAIELEPAMTYRLRVRGEHDVPTEWADQYMRMCLFFNTTSERYAWLTHSLFIARGRLRGADDLEYDVYRVR